MNRIRLGGILCLVIPTSVVLAQTFGVQKRMPRPEEYGNVVMQSATQDAAVASVVFKHWLHRAKYTCRLCHVDVGFAMEAGGTRVREADIRAGLYCGACHNGKDAFAPVERTAGGATENCRRCHSFGVDVEPKHSFRELVQGLPRSRFGNRVDWVKAEADGLIKLSDYIEGVSIRRRALSIPEAETIQAKVPEMPDIIFSHDKHAVWNGCELCHPQIFGVKKGGTVYEMQEIFAGRYCGACHGKVAFMNQDCQLCHASDVY